MAKHDHPTFKAHPTLVAALKECNGAVPEGMRPYVVRFNGQTRYVVSHSKGAAALAVVEVETCSAKECLDALLSSTN